MLDVQASLQSLRRQLLAKSVGRCAKHVRLALQAGGVDIVPHPVSARDYDSYLLDHGFGHVGDHTVEPVAGDVCVIQNCQGHPHGHIAMYDGEVWISDFEQRDIWSGPKFRRQRPSCRVYRFVGRGAPVPESRAAVAGAAIHPGSGEPT